MRLLPALGTIICLLWPGIVVAQSFSGTNTYHPVERPAPKQASEYQVFTAPAMYREAYHEARRCLAQGTMDDVLWWLQGYRARSFDRVVWVEAPGQRFTAPDGTPGAIGFWAMPDTIIIGREWKTTRWVIRHELIHYLLQMAHPADARRNKRIWGEQCKATWGYLE
jgi:hypothetical protein